jgi:hypothetical protein
LYESFAITEKHILRKFDNKLLRMILGHKREKATMDRRKLQDEELHTYTLCLSIKAIK